MNNNSYSRYRNINTIIHRIDPITKLISFILFAISIFLAQNIEELSIVIGFIFVISLFSKTKIKTYFKIILLLIPVYFITLLIYFAVVQKILYSLYITTQITMRIFLFILTSVIYTSTTKEMEIANSIEWLITPLKIVKIPTYEISMMITLAIRFLPLMILDMNRILIAQTSRGINSINGTFKERVAGMKKAFLPLFVLSFKRADEISIAMEIRGYKIGSKRTKFVKNKFGIIEIISLLQPIILGTIIILSTIGIIPGINF